MQARFRVFRSFEDPSLTWAASSRFELDQKSAPSFRGDALGERIVRALAERHAIKVKEVLESFETFDRVRRTLRGPRVADLCCGHGLTGLLFAAYEREVEDVVLLDKVRPSRAERVLAAVIDAAPWVEGKVRWVEDRVTNATEHLARGTSLIAVHACGARTDRALDAALELGSPVAVLPCCYARTAQSAPPALREALGVEQAADIDRTYRLERAGWSVRWSSIPAAITPMNRLLVAVPRAS